MHFLQQAEDMVKLRIQKDEDNIGTLNPPDVHRRGSETEGNDSFYGA